MRSLPRRIGAPRRPPLPRFAPDLHEAATATAVGRWLGIAVATCFVTGLWSHLLQHPPAWFDPPATPAWGYRLTQGLHVASGVAAVPLLLAKLWVVYPRLFTWPPVRSLRHAAERLSVALLVAAVIFELATGIANAGQWYPWRFGFTGTHYAVAWLAAGALALHLAVVLPRTRGGERTAAEGDLAEGEPADGSPDAVASRRRFLATTFGAAAAVTALSAGQSVPLLAPVAVLSPRRAGAGPQDVPVNKTAAQARVLERLADPDYRLQLAGPRPVALSLTQLRAMPQRTVALPIACVEGWSSTGVWRGVPLRDLLALAGAGQGARALLWSLEPSGPYRRSVVGPAQAAHPDTLVALELGGAPLHPDHGYPARLIAPNRPGVFQTKWLQRIEVA